MKIGNMLAIAATAATVLLAACTPSAPTGYTVTGLLPDSSLNGKKAYLCPTTSQEVIDTTIINGDKFIFEGVADSAMLAFLSIEGAQLYGALIVENGNITLDFTTVKEGKGPYGSGTENNRIMTEILLNLDSISREEIKDEALRLFAKHNNDIIGVLLFTSPYYRCLDNETRLATIEGMGEYLKNLTADRYNGLILGRDWQLQVRETASGLTRPLLTLSTGTRDLVWLALRLAMTKLLLPAHAPLVLDDALLTFDEARTAAALDVLRRSHRQVLLFSCKQVNNAEC